MVRITKAGKIILRVLMIFAVFTETAFPDLIITEVMSNEPGGSTSLEWFEVYNDLTGSRPLAFFTPVIDGEVLTFTEGTVEPSDYTVICKNIPRFDSTWGNSSGIWGDSLPLENYPLVQLSGFSLINDTGRVALYIGPILITEFIWGEAGADGVSWERIYFDSALIGNSVDPTGSTPGRLNSLVPLNHDLAIVSAVAKPIEDGWCYFEFKIANVGTQAVSGNELKIYYDPDSNGVAEITDFIGLIVYSAMAPGDTLTLEDYFVLDGLYPYVLIELPDDNRLTNNKQVLMAFGEEYPPFAINEFIADPKDNLETEWVEILNLTTVAVDLSGWLIGDESNFRPIISSVYFVLAEEYIVLCKDSAAFRSFYSNSAVPVIQVSSWAALGNNGDIVRLRDDFGNVVDSFAYDIAFGGNYSWGRSSESEFFDSWGRSVDIGGTPGEPNENYRQASGTKVEISAEPNPFSPSSDGLINIGITAPPGENMTLKIFDSRGRKVRTLLDGLPSFDGNVEWDGRDDDGRPLNVGIYILYLEVSGIDSYKQTVVIAP